MDSDWGWMERLMTTLKCCSKSHSWKLWRLGDIKYGRSEQDELLLAHWVGSKIQVGTVACLAWSLAAVDYQPRRHLSGHENCNPVAMRKVLSVCFQYECGQFMFVFDWSWMCEFTGPLFPCCQPPWLRLSIFIFWNTGSRHSNISWVWLNICIICFKNVYVKIHSPGLVVKTLYVGNLKEIMTWLHFGT